VSDQPAGEVILHQRVDGTPDLEVRLQGEKVWLSQHQIAELFQTSRENITMHLRNVFDEGELDADATRQDFLQVRREGTRKVQRNVAHYNLDAIISVGYRIKSRSATRLRIWATDRLREYLVKGFTMDDARLRELGGARYWREHLEHISDSRSSEKLLYRQVFDLYATSIDYDPGAVETAEFFKVVQNKLHYAAHGRTAAEVIADRADASQPNVSLPSFAGKRPRKRDISIAKNYLSETELKRLNALVSAYFDAAESRAQSHLPTYMKDCLAHLDPLIVAMDAKTLEGAGSVSREKANEKATGEYEKYRAQPDAGANEIEEHYLDSVKKAQRRIERKK